LSRNFELLNQVGLQGVLEPSTFSPAPTLVPEPDPTPSTPALELNGPLREEIAKLVLNLFMLPGSGGPRRVVLTGMESGAGCSWMCARAAEVLASQVAGSVCVVDCNLRSPTLHREFSVENHFGLSDALLQTNPVRQYVQQLSRRNLWLLSCGSPIDDWQEKVASSKMDHRMKELQAEFDYVLLDVAPIQNINDAIVLGALVDGVVLILKANSTRREVTHKTVQQLKTANIPILGAVLNQRTFPIPEKIYKWF
jgi:protein-tyrosine kinase